MPIESCMPTMRQRIASFRRSSSSRSETRRAGSAMSSLLDNVSRPSADIGIMRRELAYRGDDLAMGIIGIRPGIDHGIDLGLPLFLELRAELHELLTRRGFEPVLDGHLQLIGIHSGPSALRFARIL